MAQFAVFASGQGSNLVALHAYFSESAIPHSICCLVSDKPACQAVAYALSKAIPVIYINYAGQDKALAEQQLVDQLRNYQPAVLVFAGFMRLAGQVLLHTYQGRIINLHPSLLPRHPGKQGIIDSFNAGDSELGITIHYVDEGIDTGRIIRQESFFRTADDTLPSIEARIHALEHTYYPQTIHALLDTKNAVEAS